VMVWNKGYSKSVESTRVLWETIDFDRKTG
jgi:hypothetical protein